jgi:RNA polymerase sigma factor (sigma-70 family)
MNAAPNNHRPTLESKEFLLAQGMALAQLGDAQAYRDVLGVARAILQAYASGVLRRMGKYDANTVEDMVQEILIALHEKRHTYDPRRAFLPWLFAIARYKLIDFGRKEKRRPIQIHLDAVEQALSAPVFQEAGSAQDLAVAMAKLPEKSRHILEMVKVEGLSVAEAAAKTRMTESALKVAVHRALKMLRGEFKDQR